MQLPGEALGKKNGNKRKQRSKCRPPEPPSAPESPARAAAQGQGQGATPGLSPRVPGVTSGQSFDQEGGPAPPTPSLNVSSLIRTCRERAEENGRVPGASITGGTGRGAPRPPEAPLQPLSAGPASQRHLQRCSSTAPLHPEPLGSP